MTRKAATNGSGYFAIGIYQPKSEVNIGTLWRTANLMGASLLFTVGKRYQTQGSDTMNSDKHIPLVHFNTIDDLLESKQETIHIIGVELTDSAIRLNKFVHPHSAWYMLGAEDRGIPQNILDKMDSVITIPSLKPYSLNVSVAGSIVAYDRLIKGQKQ